MAQLDEHDKGENDSEGLITKKELKEAVLCEL
jgi:hypothetical protein